MRRVSTVTGVLRWVPASENGPTIPFDGDRITAFARLDSDPTAESALVVRGLVAGATECSVEAEWVDGYPALATSPGDVIMLTASQRPIARITVGEESSA